MHEIMFDITQLMTAAASLIAAIYGVRNHNKITDVAVHTNGLVEQLRVASDESAANAATVASIPIIAAARAEGLEQGRSEERKP